MVVVIQHAKKWKYFWCDKCGCSFKADESEYHTLSVLVQNDVVNSAACACPDCGNMAVEDPNKPFPC